MGRQLASDTLTLSQSWGANYSHPFRAVGRSENPGVPVAIRSPLVEIGFTDLPNSGYGTPGNPMDDTPAMYFTSPKNFHNYIPAFK
jgi:hypothetical protein